VVGGVYTGPTGSGLVLVTDDTTLANAGLGVHEPVVVRDGDGVLRSTYRAWPDPAGGAGPGADRGGPGPRSGGADAPEAWSVRGADTGGG
jgi:hypothetical protein